ncbi:MAG: DNA-binding protein [Erysipelotrichaceae bacterium]|nr:DNA-binding protein [Erysipelotrichaceae bacterium]
MKYRRIEDTIIVRIDRGEEILEKMKEVAIRENIKLANVNALGAVDDFTVGVYNVDEQKYYSKTFTGAYEIVSLTGSINTMNGEYYAHMHMSAADSTGATYGGHLNRAVVSATCEMFINIIHGEVDRFKDEVTGLNLFDL